MKTLITTGGTGGHIFPALRVADVLKRGGHEVVFAGVFGNYRKDIEQQGYALNEIHARGLVYGSVASFFTAPFFMVWAFFESLGVLSRTRPHVVVGFGGYGAFPLCLAAVLSGKPTLIHEQNVVPGRSNKLLAATASRIAVSFEESGRFFNSKKTVVTGCPVKRRNTDFDRQRALQELGLTDSKFTILVLGGSQGSRRINMEFIGCIPNLKQQLDFQVIHVTGQGDYAECEKMYARYGVQYHLSAFLNGIEKAYQLADCVITRAGAATVTEIIGFSLQAIVIPYPHAGGHQKYNAEVLKSANAGIVIPEEELTQDKLLSAIQCIKGNDEIKENIKKLNSQIYNTHAAEDIGREAIQLGKI